MKKLLIAAACLLAASAYADTGYTATTTGSSAGFGFGANATTTGTASFSINSSTELLSYTLSWNALTSDASSAGIQCCSALANTKGELAVQFGDFVGGSETGSFSGMVDLTQASSYNTDFLAANGGTAASAYAALISGLNTKLGYAMVYSTFTGGQAALRGQLSAVPVPEPASYGLMALGLGIVALRRRHLRDEQA